MPIYEFRCSSCDHVFEELIFRKSEIQELVCPRCGATQVNQQMSTFASTSESHSGGCGGGGMPPSCGGSGGFS